MSKLLDDLARQEEQERRLAIERALTFEKAFKSNDIEAIMKAQDTVGAYMSKYRQQNNFGYQFSNGPGKAMLVDPFDATTSQGYYSKTAQVDFNMLRALRCVPIIAAIIGTRKNQIMEYCTPQDNKYSKGFLIKKDGVDDDDDLTDSDKREIERIQKFLLNCGNDDDMWKDDDFDSFMKKLVDDSLTLDAATAEIVPTRGLKPYSFYHVDAATIRFSDTKDNRDKDGAVKVNGKYPKYVQIYQNRICAEFYPWEMLYGIRNPQPSMRANGYGKSELEFLLRTLTDLLNADSYNGNYFRNGSSPKGMMMVKNGSVNKDRLSEFRKDFQTMMSGVQNAHKTMFMDAEAFEWVDMTINNKDMEFSKFQEYLIKLVCAVYKISPEEVGFTLEGSKSGGLGRGDGKEEKDYSINKGLKPILVEISQWINKWIVGPLTNYRYKFVFVGINVESEKEEEEKINKQVTTYLTPDEVRKDKGLKPLPDGMGKLPLNPLFSQMQMNQQQQQMEAQNKQEEQENEQFENSNPFMDDDSPLVKSFDEWFERNLVA